MTGKVIFITGASTGIGRAAANRFAAAGATVIGTSRWPWRYPTPSWCVLIQCIQLALLCLLQACKACYKYFCTVVEEMLRTVHQ